MNILRTRTASLALLAAAAAGLPTAARAAAACGANTAPFSLYASSYLESQLNPPPGEDVEFFAGTGGVPSIYFLLDNSGSMSRLPPNGAAFYRYPSPPQGIVGCGLDAVSAPYAVANTAVRDILDRTYSSPCGKAVHQNLIGAPFDATQDYAHEASACPYYQQGFPIGSNGFNGPTGKDGYDPDFYCGSTGGTKTCGTKPNYFDQLLVFHDAANDNLTAKAGSASCNTIAGVNAGNCNSWTDTSVNPSGTVAAFCATQAGTQGGVARSTICTQCLNTRGFYFDGNVYSSNQENIYIPGPTGTPATPVDPTIPGALVSSVPCTPPIASNLQKDQALGGCYTGYIPGVWYTGRFLNFYPPKHVVARKAMKDLLMNYPKIRVALGTFSGPVQPAGLAQLMNPTCSGVSAKLQTLYDGRSAYMTAINGIGFTTGTPLGTTMFNLARFFRTPGLPWFGQGANATWDPPSNATAAGKGQQAFCYPCQSTSLIVVTDGRPKSNDDLAANFAAASGTTTQAQANTTGLYAGAASTGIATLPDCPDCNLFLAAGKDWLDWTIRTSWYLHNMDFRQDSEQGAACVGMAGKQSVNVYTLGFGTDALLEAGTMLAAAANVGGGRFVPASSPGQLTDAVAGIVADINTRATSFSVASVTALQATAGQSVLVPRFTPAASAQWKGHLYRFEIYSEFAAGCTAGSTGDLDCDCACNSVFLKDKDGSFISEDATGAFVKNVPNAPNCGATNRCATCGLPGTVAAVPWWDAGATPSAANAGRTWKRRAVYTAIDSNADGAIDRADGAIALIDPTTNSFVDANVTALIPYMGLGNGAVCSLVSSKMRSAGDTVTANLLDTGDSSRLNCAKMLLRWLLGADAFNDQRFTAAPSGANGCKYPDSLDNLCDRDFRLGDVFHSSPVTADPPLPSSGVLCSRGLHNQCLTSLWATAVKNKRLGGSTNTYAYDDYVDFYKNRRKVVLVGANDGMLHALDGGTWRANQDNPDLLPSVRTSLAPFLGYFDRGSGTELWAFLPPDLLPKVGLMLQQHHYFVDGTPMVRDVWVDGSAPNGMGGTSSANDVKEPNEYHTVAIVPERRGGTHYFALDVTDAWKGPSEPGFAAPRFLWIYPQPLDQEQLSFGETYSDFLPTPPPIGPVRIDATTMAPAPSSDTPSYQNASGASVPFHERWIGFLSGGFDPQYQRGRGVHMVDAWTGAELFDFSRPADGVAVGSDPRQYLDFPVAATVGMMMWGKQVRALNYDANGGYFDTATFGDTGSQLWVIRFNSPGHLTGGKADNWFGARAFQSAKTAGPTFCGQAPFFYITSNVILAANGMYRVAAGTGDRFNLLDTYGGTCGPDNIRACFDRGCTVTMLKEDTSTSPATLLNGVNVDTLLGKRQTGISAAACGAVTESSPQTATGNACNAIQGRVRLVISNCVLDDPSFTTTTKEYRVDCGPTATGGYGCAPPASFSPSTGDTILQKSAPSGMTSNSFASVRVWDDAGARMPFDSLAAAAAYDAARLQASDLTAIDGSSATPATTSVDSAGWLMKYNHDGNQTFNGQTYSLAKQDERTASPSAVIEGCAYWNTVQPTLTSSPCPCKAANTDRLSFFYGAKVGTGDLCLKSPTVSGSGPSCTVSASYARSLQGTTLTTPPAPQVTTFVSKTGQVATGLTSISVGQGALNVNVGTVRDATSPLEWLDVPREVHGFRHSPAAGPPPPNRW